MEAGQVDPGIGDQGGKPGNEVQSFEDDMRRPILIRRLELVTDIATGGVSARRFSKTAGRLM